MLALASIMKAGMTVPLDVLTEKLSETGASRVIPDVRKVKLGSACRSSKVSVKQRARLQYQRQTHRFAIASSMITSSLG